MEGRRLRQRTADTRGRDQRDDDTVIAGQAGGVLLRAAIPGEGRVDGQRFGDSEAEIAFGATDPIVGAVDREIQVAVQSRIGYRDLHVVPILLIDRAVELQATIKPSGFPTDLFVLKRVRGIGLRHCEYAVQGRVGGNNPRANIEAAGSEAFRVGGVEQDIVRNLPTQIDLAFVTGEGFPQPQGIQARGKRPGASARSRAAASIDGIL